MDRSSKHWQWLTGGPVYDWIPEPLPPVSSAHLDRIVKSDSESGKEALAVHDRLADERARQFRDDADYRATVKEYLRATGVTIFGSTLISLGQAEPQGWESVIHALRRVQMYVDAADWLTKALSPADLHSEGVSILLQLEDTAAINGSLSRLDELYDFGVRTVQLTYNTRNLVGDGCAELTNAGLSTFGHKVVQRANELGMMIELSHCGEATTIDAINASSSPPACSHVFCRALRPEVRGKTDEVLKQLAAVNGYVGIAAIPFFQQEANGFETMLNHIDHAVNILGVDRVGIGTNWGIWTPEVPRALREGIHQELRSHLTEDTDQRTMGVGLSPMDTYEKWKTIPDGLDARGYTSEEVRMLCGGSFANYFDRIR